MGAKDLGEFEKWYESKRKENYTLLSKLEEYAVKDVLVLHRGCAIFRKENIESVGVDPFFNSVRIWCRF